MTGYSSFSCLIFRYKSELKGPWWWCSSGQHPRSLNLAKVYNFSVKIVVEKDENKQKGPWLTLSNKYSKLERKHLIGPINYCSFTKPSLNEKKKCFFSKKKLNQCLKKCWRLKVKVREKKRVSFYYLLLRMERFFCSFQLCSGNAENKWYTITDNGSSSKLGQHIKRERKAKLRRM